MSFRLFSLINNLHFDKNIYLQKALNSLEKFSHFSTTKLKKLKDSLESWIKIESENAPIGKIQKYRKDLKKQLKELKEALPEELVNLRKLVSIILEELDEFTKEYTHMIEKGKSLSDLKISQNIHKLYSELASYQKLISYKKITKILVKSFQKSLDLQNELKTWKKKVLEIVRKSKETNSTIPKVIEELFQLPFIRSILLNEMPVDLRDYIIDQVSIDEEILNLEEEFIKSE